MYELFPGNYRWSYNTWAALAAGAEFGDISLILDRLQKNAGNDDEWYAAWSWLAGKLELRAEGNLAVGTKASAADNYFLASLYHKVSEQFIQPTNPIRLDTYKRSLRTFEKARNLSEARVERVLVPYDGKTLPAYFVPTRKTSGRAPTVIFLCGLDTTKEMSCLRVRDKLAARGINLLAIDTPGVGEALRLGRIVTRHDYEVPIGATIDYLLTRADVDAKRIGIIGSSLGGYYVARAAAFEPRLRAVVAWGANYDYHAVWQRRLTVGGTIAAPIFQLTYITGTDRMEAALHHIRDFKVEPIGHRITCPFLIAHGSEDQQISLDDAKRMFAVIASQDKKLKIFNGEDGGAAHCQFDNHLPALLHVSDWLAQKLQ